MRDPGEPRKDLPGAGATAAGARVSGGAGATAAGPRVSGWAIAGWGVVAVLGVMAVLAMLTVGVFILPVAVVLAVVLLRRGGFGTAAAGGLIVGAGLPLGWIAYLNRHGPGDFCEARAGVTRCIGQWSPWPWLAVALACLIVGGLLVRLGRRRRPVA